MKSWLKGGLIGLFVGLFITLLVLIPTLSVGGSILPILLNFLYLTGFFIFIGIILSFVLMKIKKVIQNKKYWFKGGLIGLFVGLILGIAGILFSGLCFLDTGSFCKSFFNIVYFPTVKIFINFPLRGFFGGLRFLGLIFLDTLIKGVLIGAIIGWIVGKIKSKNISQPIQTNQTITQ